MLYRRENFRKTVRTEMLIEDYLKNEFTLVELISKYRISSTRIYQILEENGIDTNTKLPLDKGSKK